jgi:hypothetical protein
MKAKNASVSLVDLGGGSILVNARFQVAGSLKGPAPFAPKEKVAAFEAARKAKESNFQRVIESVDFEGAL